MSAAKTPTKSTTISQLAFAKKVGVTHTAVAKAIAAGRLKKSVVKNETTGKVSIIEAIGLLEWEKNTLKTMQRKEPAVPATKRAASAAAAASVAIPTPPSSSTTTHGKSPSVAIPTPATIGELELNEARATKANYDAGRAKLAYERDVGSLVEVDFVARALESMTTIVRTKLTALPHLLAKKLSTTADEHECKLILEDAIHAALSELSATPPA